MVALQRNTASFTALQHDAAQSREPGQAMFYQFYEMNHAALQPLRAFADSMRLLYSNPLNPLTATPFGRSVAASAELFERTTSLYCKPAFGIASTKV